MTYRRNYDDPVYKDVRKKVLKRDKRVCQMPGCKSKYRLNVHHIKKWSAAASLRYDPYNLITLCKNCHNEVTGKEEHYESLLLSVAKDNECSQ